MGRQIDDRSWLLAAYWGLITLLVCSSVFFALRVQSRRREWAPASEVAVPSGSKVTVIDVLNGDEVAVQAGEAILVVRLLGVKTFDAKSNDATVAGLGVAAIHALREAMESKDLRVVYDERKADRHERLLAYLEADGRDLGAALVEAGQALTFIRFGFGREASYLALEAAARSRGFGLWGQPKAAERARALEATWRSQRDDD